MTYIVVRGSAVNLKSTKKIIFQHFKSIFKENYSLAGSALKIYISPLSDIIKMDREREGGRERKDGGRETETEHTTLSSPRIWVMSLRSRA